MLAITDCKLWVMERGVYMAIKRTYQEQLAALKRKMVASVPILAVLSEVPLSSRLSQLSLPQPPLSHCACAGRCMHISMQIYLRPHSRASSCRKSISFTLEWDVKYQPATAVEAGKPTARDLCMPSESPCACAQGP